VSLKRFDFSTLKLKTVDNEELLEFKSLGIIETF